MRFKKHAMILNRIRMDWGKKSNKSRDFIRLRDEYELVKNEESHLIGDQTWHDLEMDTLFSEMDQTKTYAGSLMLYKSLRETKSNEEEIKRVGKELDIFIDNPSIREHIQVALAKLGLHDLSGMLYFLDRTLYFEPIYKALAYIFTIMPFISLAAVIFLGKNMFYLLAISLLSNFILNLVFTKYILINKNHFTVVRSMIISASKIGQIEHSGLSSFTAPLKELSKRCRNIVVKSSGLKFLENDPTGLAVYIDMIFMVSIRTFFRIIDLINTHQKDLVEIYKLVGRADALAGMASYRSSLKEYCRPVFNNKNKFLELEEAFNPLVDNYVKNSIKIDNENIYLTGSNMSGKSTFLRSVGVNVLLAQTFDFVFCEKYNGAFMKIYSSISRNDDILQGKSYFLAEAEIVLDMINQSNDNITSLILIDEIFRGTNTKERIEASVGVLNYFAKQNAIVFVATHDLEIKDKADSSYKNYHFGENVGEHGIEFDYKLKEGTTVVGNALKILKYLGYPNEIF